MRPRFCDNTFFSSRSFLRRPTAQLHVVLNGVIARSIEQFFTPAAVSKRVRTTVELSYVVVSRQYVGAAAPTFVHTTRRLVPTMRGISESGFAGRGATTKNDILMSLLPVSAVVVAGVASVSLVPVSELTLRVFQTVVPGADGRVDVLTAFRVIRRAGAPLCAGMVPVRVDS
jgi:hypothetical protein